MLRALFGIVKAAVGAVCRIVGLALKLVYRILAFLHIRLLALYLLVCAVLSLFYPIFTDAIAVFWVGFGLCAAATLLSWFFAAKRALARRPRREPAEEKPQKGGKKREKEPAEEAQEGQEQPRRRERREKAPAPKPRYPLYFDVEGHPGYFFAEYADRYELYRREGDGAVYIRTDRK